MGVRLLGARSGDFVPRHPRPKAIGPLETGTLGHLEFLFKWLRGRSGPVGMGAQKPADPCYSDGRTAPDGLRA